MWKAPHRPKGEISQAFNDGIVTVYSVEDNAPAGFKPVEKLTKKVVLNYEERRLGINRFLLIFTDETKEETIEILNLFTKKIKPKTNYYTGFIEEKVI